MTIKMTNEEYVKRGGNDCPNCKSQNITASSCETEGTSASQDCYCYDCNYEWTDVFQLVGYENFTTNEVKE